MYLYINICAKIIYNDMYGGEMNIYVAPMVYFKLWFLKDRYITFQYRVYYYGEFQT